MYCRSVLKSVNTTGSVRLFMERFISTKQISLNELAKKSIVYSENEGYIVKSPYKQVSIPELTVDQYVWKDMPKWQNHIAIQCGDTGRRYTYAKLRDHCAALAIRMRTKLMLQKGDIVAICLPNVPEYAIAWLGSSEAGLVVTTVNPWYTSEEISRQFINSRPKAVFCLIDNFEVVKNACKLADQPDIKVIAIKSDTSRTFYDEMINFTELMDLKGVNLSESSNFNDGTKFDDLAVLPYSSGTTGLPKGVMLSHRNMVSNCEAHHTELPFDRIVQPTTNDYQDVVPCFLPFFHAYGLIPLMLDKLALGTKIISIPKFEPNQFLQISKEQKATLLHMVPPVIILLGNSEAAKPEHFKHARYLISAASNLAQHDADRLMKKAPHAAFFQGYGLTETSPLATLPPQGLRNYGTIGWPISNTEMKVASIDDPTFKGLNVNESGEILVRGHNIMKGYYKNEEATEATMFEDWFRTGDIGHYDETGLFYVSDRLKELIKVNANQVAPAELEGILRDHPCILDAVVIGVPDVKCGEIPKAFVIRRPNSKATEGDIQQFVAKQVIKYKNLSGGVQFVDSIPKSATGKILRREVRKAFA